MHSGGGSGGEPDMSPRPTAVMGTVVHTPNVFCPNFSSGREASGMHGGAVSTFLYREVDQAMQWGDYGSHENA